MNFSTATTTACTAILLLAAVTSAFPRNHRRCLRACPMNFDPVCDNEGTTHPNQCSMEVVACRRRVILQVVSKGICQTAEEPSPAAPTPARNLLGRILNLFSDPSAEGTQECRFICPFTYRPVCASDGRTYPNECTMKSQACMQQLTLSMQHEGPCRIWSRR